MGLGGVRRAGDVGEDAAGRERADGRVEQLALQPREVGDVRGRLAPARLGAAAERAEPRARRVEEDAVEPARSAERVEVELAAVADVHVDGRRDPGEGLAHELGPGRDHLVGDHRRTGGQRLGREHGGLAARARAEVEPPLPRRARARRASARARRAASPRPAPGCARSTPRRRRWGRRRPRRSASTGRARAPGCRRRRRRVRAARRGSRAARRCRPRAARSSSSPRPSCRSAARRARTIQRGWLSSRARRSSSPFAPSATRSRHASGDDREIVRSTALAKPAAFGATRLAIATCS